MLSFTYLYKETEKLIYEYHNGNSWRCKQFIRFNCLLHVAFLSICVL